MLESESDERVLYCLSREFFKREACLLYSGAVNIENIRIAHLEVMCTHVTTVNLTE